jgi:endogenous inhibitor of DNA gyrase (YacG/DUF329 family)
MTCPNCGKPVKDAENPARPFCSERCKMIDLGKWVGGAFRIPTQEIPSDESESSNGPRESSEHSQDEE